MSLSEDIGFVAYRLPNEIDHHVCNIHSITKRTESTDISDYDFVVAPFDKFNRDTYLLKFSKVITNENIPEVQLSNGIFDDITKENYLTDCQKLIHKLSIDHLSKVVLSRTHSIKASNISTDEIFKNMMSSYPKAFIYLFHHPQIGTWAAATPELLLSSENSTVKTVALAGTRKYDSLSSDSWGSKEIAEHKYIETFINERLDKVGLPYSKTKTFTQRAGNVEHIKSIYDIQLGENDFIHLADLLHPGPAISGYPIDDAMDIIKEIEAHDRQYYCGYLGPLKHKGNHYLYVNLRCMEIFDNGYKMYIGGGITSDSKAEDEWIETKLKSGTLSAMVMSTHYENHQ
ncbi:chorismate-binding protein [Saprospiraceae bacterium]|nr:chorismate-binding protein [Saprospiraceae bacterium]